MSPYGELELAPETADPTAAHRRGDSVVALAGSLPPAAINRDVFATEPAVPAAAFRHMHVAAGALSAGDDYLYEPIADDLVACQF